MKKKLILVLLFFITGCSSKLNFNNEINRIKYNNNNIYYQDYDTIINDLNSIKWNCDKKDNNYNESNLIINTKDSIMNFYFSNNYYMEYKNNNKYCYTKNKKVVKKLKNNLDNLINKYKNTDFIKLELIDNYDFEENDTIIKLDKTDSYLVLDVVDDIYNFKIHQIERNNDAIQEIDLVYDSEFIDKKILIRIDKNNISNYKINFKNKYNYDFEIFLNYNKNTFSFEIKQK